MNKQSNLNSIKTMARTFLYMDIHLTPYSPAVVLHPVFETGFTMTTVNGEPKLVNMLNDHCALRTAQSAMRARIDTQKTVRGVYDVIRKSYKLTFLKYVHDHLSLSDMSELLADAWVNSENPNQDVNVPISLATDWFYQSDKSMLMHPDELAFFQALPQTITVYRGVAVGRTPDGLSWTCNLEKAKWFANRFNKEQETGYVLAATIDKSFALAYFNRRGEDEVVVDTSAIEHCIRRLD